MNQLTDEQKAILHVAQTTRDNLVIDALAGSGKTFTLLALLEVLPEASVLLCAFNKRIADELEEKKPQLPRGRMCKVQTLHAAGLSVLRSHFFGLNVEDEEATESVITSASVELQINQGQPGLAMNARRAAVRLLTQMKETCIEPEVDAELVRKTGDEFGHFEKLDNAAQILQVSQTVAIAYAKSRQFRERKQIAFADMIWGSVVSGVAPKSRYKAIIVDEAQDVSVPQLAFVEKLLAPGGRLIIAGDINQAIYGWRGAAGTALWKKMKTHYKARFMPLTTTWRCSKQVVAQAQTVVPKLRARPGAAEGKIRSIDFSTMAGELKRIFEKTFVLSRNNAMLLSSALELWKAGVPFTLNAPGELIEPLFNLLRKLDKFSAPAFTSSLETWFLAETKRAEAAQSSAWADRVESYYGMLKVALEYAHHPSRIEGLLEDLLRNRRKTSILLSTVHKVKGLEADYVFLLKETFERHKPRRKPGKPVDQEELNIEYVGITRAKQMLVWVSVETMMQKIFRWTVEAEGENVCSVAPGFLGDVAIDNGRDSMTLPATHPVAQAALADAAARGTLNFDDFEIDLASVKDEG